MSLPFIMRLFTDQEGVSKINSPAPEFFSPAPF